MAAVRINLPAMQSIPTESGRQQALKTIKLGISHGASNLQPSLLIITSIRNIHTGEIGINAPTPDHGMYRQQSKEKQTN